MSENSRLSLSQPFAYPFRIFFLSVAIWAVIAIPVWVFTFPAGKIAPDFALSLYAWHAHEMLFGFFAVAMAGFLMTATCNWTQTERLHGWPLFGMWLAWLLGRITMLCGGHLPYVLVAVVNLAFLPLVIFDVAKRVWLRRQTRQYTLVAVISFLWLMQLGFLITKGDMHFAFGTLILAMGVMMIIGGRITPNFTRNWLSFNSKPENADRISISPLLEKLTPVSIFVLLAATLADLVPGIHGLDFYSYLLALLALAAAIIAFTRLALWHGWLAMQDPLLWILHLSMLWIPVALLLMALNQLFPAQVNAFAWVHALAVGGMAGLIIGVMTRVALGHTGRMLQLPRFMIITYVLIHLGALVRLAAEFVPAHFAHLIYCSAILWTLAFGYFLVVYLPILISPRADGREG